MEGMLQHRLRDSIRGLFMFFLALAASLLAMGLLVFALSTLCWPLVRYALHAEPSFTRVAAGVLAALIVQAPVVALVLNRLPKRTP